MLAPVSLLGVTPLLNPLDNNPLPDSTNHSLFGLGMREILLIVGVAVVLALLLFLWAYLTHKDGRHSHSSHRLSKPITRAKKMSPEKAAAKGVRVRRKRRDHPDNLPRNPTLGETGGLPPIRPDEPPSEVAQQ